MIDVFKSPKESFHYDTYDGQALDLEYVCEHLARTNPYAGLVSNYRLDEIDAPAGLAGNLFLLQNLGEEFAKLRSTEPFATHYYHHPQGQSEVVSEIQHRKEMTNRAATLPLHNHHRHCGKL